jgi:hypothetical protein
VKKYVFFYWQVNKEFWCRGEFLGACKLKPPILYSTSSFAGDSYMTSEHKFASSNAQAGILYMFNLWQISTSSKCKTKSTELAYMGFGFRDLHRHVRVIEEKYMDMMSTWIPGFAGFLGLPTSLI